MNSVMNFAQSSCLIFSMQKITVAKTQYVEASNDTTTLYMHTHHITIPHCNDFQRLVKAT